MSSKKHLELAYGIAIVLLIIGVLSYAAFPQKAPGQPERIMYQGVAGKVLFNHEAHASDAGYALDCWDCHHHPLYDDTAVQYGCSDCHLKDANEEILAEACWDCHAPEDVEGSFVPARKDAFHDQCIGCHEDFEQGPVECSDCHVTR